MADCTHKYVLLETVKYKEQAGRNSITYVCLDRFFCERCLEQKEMRQTHDGTIGETYGLPEWAKDVTKYIDNGYRY